jgi:integrase
MSSSSFEKVAECLYRNPSSRTYYALVKVRGKQFKQSLRPRTCPKPSASSATTEPLEVARPSSGRAKKVEKPIRHTPTREQFDAIVTSIRGQSAADTREDSADFVQFLGLASLGLAEASSLMWADVDFARSQIIIFRHKTRMGFG